MKDRGLNNNLIDLIAEDPMFGLTREELTANLEPSRYICLLYTSSQPIEKVQQNSEKRTGKDDGGPNE